MKDRNRTTNGRRNLFYKTIRHVDIADCDIPVDRIGNDVAPCPDEDYISCELGDILSQDLNFATIMIDPTYFCNMECGFCDLPIKSRNSIDIEQIKIPLMALSLSGVKNLVLTGGEPGIYPGLLELLSVSSDLKFHTSILTNGSWAAKIVVAERIISCGISQVVMSLKAFSREQSLALTGKDFFQIQATAIGNLSVLAENGILDKFVINHVVCSSTLKSLPNLVNLLTQSYKPTIVLSLVEPYTEAMLPLVPPFDELRRELALSLSLFIERGLDVVVEGMPFCLLDDFRHLSRDGDRRRDDRAKVLIRPKDNDDLVLFYRGYQRINQFAQPAPCERCVQRNLCPGIHAKLIDNWSDKLIPYSFCQY